MSDEIKATVNPILVNVIKMAMELVATSRTTKYILSSKEFDSNLDRIAETFEVLRKGKGNTITSDGEMYDVSEYHIPAKLVDYVNAGRYFVTADAIGSATPYGLALKDAKKAVTPQEFNRFFNNFNLNQGESAKFNLCENYSRKILTLGDFEFAKDADGSLVKISDNGSIPAEITVLCGNKTVYPSNVLTHYSAPSEEMIARWLLR